MEETCNKVINKSGMENGYLLSYSLQEPYVSSGGKEKSERQDPRHGRRDGFPCGEL